MYLTFSYFHQPIHNASRGHSNNLGRVKIDRRGILTVKSILDERANAHHTSLRDRRPAVNEGRFNGVERRRSSNTFNSDLNTFRSNYLSSFFFFHLLKIIFLLISGDRPIEDIRPTRHDTRVSRRPISNTHSVRRPPERSTRPSRVNEKPYSRPMAMDYEDSMEWEEPNRYSPTPVSSIFFFSN